MSPYERQIDPLEAVDVNYVLGIPGQATSDETMEPLLSSPLSAQRLGTHDAASEVLPTASELLALAGIEVGTGLSTDLPTPRSTGLGYDPTLGYDTGSYLRAERDTEISALLNDSGNHSALLLPSQTGLDPRLGVGLAGTALAGEDGLRLSVVTVVLAVLAGLGSAISVAAYADGDGPSAGQIARANGAATSQVLAQDLGVVMGTYTRGGLPVRLTNTAHRSLAYNVSIEALDAAGRRITADVAFVGTLAAGQSTVVTLFSGATGGSAAELVGSQFHIVEASAY
ncbi:hypothetical protein [Sporichthya sp.]|uniref:hypothetical protein n=1 Tax=Sporichthya sp. TaxID=65475 RepID=UPI00183D8565|nr:hypothetical protein [Sporichthya sp.]MBA3744137.1 hypothetical protein [Sporichthya sp.]